MPKTEKQNVFSVGDEKQPGLLRTKHTLEMLECKSGVWEPCMEFRKEKDEQEIRGQARSDIFPSSSCVRKGRTVGFEL